MGIRRKILAAAMAGAALFGTAAVQAQQTDQGKILALGVVDFPNSGSAEAQEPFQRGLALLHSFEFQHAEKAFQQAQAIDPDFAMAYWGEALTKSYSLWSWEDPKAANAILAKLAPTPEGRAAKAGTERERAYLAALDIQFGEGTEQERDDAYIDAMADIHRRWPDDVDAAAFHALAILAAEHGGRDVAAYMRSAAILEEVFPAHPDHPGVLHYMIHSYDDPDHAPLGLRAARRYGKVAPGASHALHMNSHIFLALGMWPETVQSNFDAVMADDREAAANGRGKTWCGHQHSWLVYGYLQSDQTDKAREYIDGCWSRAMEQIAAKPGDEPLTGRLALGNAMYVQLMDAAQNGAWKTPDDVPWDRLATECRLDEAYGRLLAAYHAQDGAALAAAAGDIAKYRAAILERMEGEEEPQYWKKPELDTIDSQAKGLVALSKGETESGIELLRTAVKIEHGMPVHYGPPSIAKPSLELLGEALLRAGRKDEAAKVYADAARRTPGRPAVVAGLAASAG